MKVTTRCSLTLLSGASAPSRCRAGKSSRGKSPTASWDIPQWYWEYQLSLEAATEHFRLIRRWGNPAEVRLGIREVQIVETNPDQHQLTAIALWVIQIIQAGNTENRLMEEDFKLVQYAPETLDACIWTKYPRTEEEHSGIGGQITILQVVLEEIQIGINILQRHNDVIWGEASQISRQFKSKSPTWLQNNSIPRFNYCP